MNSILISPENKKDLELIKSLLKKMGLNYKEFTNEEKEDVGLLKAMAETANDKTVPLENVMNYLNS